MIKVKNLSKSYGNKLAIDRLNFELHEGEIVGLLGLNGAGKTTTIRILTGYLIPTDGVCYIDEQNVFENPLEIKKKIGYLPENPPLYPELTVYEFLEFVSRIKKVPSERIASEIDRVCEKTNLLEVKKSIIETLSLGFRKRVGIAQAIIGNPKVVILDEPISGLDPKQIIEMRNLIQSLQSEHTVLLSSHILSELYKTCTRFIFIHKGRIIQQNSRSELISQMESIAGLEVTLSGKSKNEIENFLKTLSNSVKFLSEDTNGLTFLVQTVDEKKFKEDLFLKSGSLGIQTEFIKKQEINLEQIFMNKV